jgi:hypothetical protein
MKRACAIAAAFLAVIVTASARDYTFLAPPSVAVADFEVLMSSADKEASKQFYGQLVSQALLTVLVQQNAANVVYAPRDSRVQTGTPVYEPGMTTFAANLPAVDAAATREYMEAIKAAAAAYANAAEDSDTAAAEKAAALDTATKAAARYAAAAAGFEEFSQVASRQIARRYFPSIFRIYDKKYVESALQNGTFTVRDLYTKAVGAFAFTDLDFLVLGSVYEMPPRGRVEPAAGRIGINVRVLNTRRAEETYSYVAVVSNDLSDLPLACTQISQRIMVDLLTSSCAQLTITESAEVAGGAASSTQAGAIQGAAGWKAPDYRLFWQPRQVRQDDGTVSDSDDADMREVVRDVFYWTLPGQYVISVYNRQTQQLKAIPFSIAAGEIRSIVVERQHLESPRGTVTIGGIGPATSYIFEFKPRAQSERYWWEVFDPPQPLEPFTVTFSDGEAGVDSQGGGERSSGTAHAGAAAAAAEAEAVNVVYRPATQDLLVSNVPLASYDIVVTRNPPQGLTGITGVWYASSRLTLTSAPLAVTVRDPKDVKVQIADFGLQEKQQIDAPRTTKVTFILQPGFGYWGWIYVNDQSLTEDRYKWADKEKVTITSDYAPADWDMFPEATYTVWLIAFSRDHAYYSWQPFEVSFTKEQIRAEKDVVVFVDLPGLQETGAQAAESYEAAVRKTEEARRATLTGGLPQAALPPGSKPAVPAKAASKFFLGIAGGAGYGTYEYWDSFAKKYYWSSGPAFTAEAPFYLYVTPGLGIGLGAYLDWVSGGSFNLNGALALTMILGDPAKTGTAFVAEVGGGTGFELGAGLVFLNPKKTGGFILTIDGFGGFSGGYSVTLNAGYLFGL